MCLGSSAGEVSSPFPHLQHLGFGAREFSYTRGGLVRRAGGLSQSHCGPPVERVSTPLSSEPRRQALLQARRFPLDALRVFLPLLQPPSRPSSPSQPQGSSARSPGLEASRLLTSHWPRASGKQSRGRAPGQLQGRHLGGKFRGRATGGAEGGEVPGVGRPGGERASRAAGRSGQAAAAAAEAERAARGCGSQGGAPPPSPHPLS